MTIDLAVHHWVQAHRDPTLTQLMLWVSSWHDTPSLLTMGLLLILLVRSVGETRWVPIFLLAIPGAMLLNTGLKHWVQRPRPFMADPIVTYQTFSFPSAHAAGTAALYTCAAAWVVWRWHHEGSGGVRAAAVGVATFMILWVSASRVVLGVHYLSDVLAGIALGTLWSLACIAGVKRLYAWWASRT